MSINEDESARKGLYWNILVACMWGAAAILYLVDAMENALTLFSFFAAVTLITSFALSKYYKRNYITYWCAANYLIFGAITTLEKGWSAFDLYMYIAMPVVLVVVWLFSRRKGRDSTYDEVDADELH